MKLTRSQGYKISIVLLLTYFVAVLFLCLFDFSLDDNELPRIPLADKIAHLIMMIPLAILIYVSYRLKYNKIISFKRLVVLSLSVGLIFGITTELLQKYLTNYRSGSLYDLLADLLGVLAGCLIVFLAGISIERKMEKIIDYEHN